VNGLRETLNSPDCRFVICEVHPHRAGVDPEGLNQELEELGFSVEVIRYREAYEGDQVTFVQARK
jgi:hypothetical protein